jgi:hypothetical protein
MSIDIRCYTKLTVPDLQAKLDQFLLRNPDIFPEHYLLYNARNLELFDKEISNEFGLDPKSYFRMHVINKTFEISTDKMADMIRNALGKENVIVLLNGEDLI